VIATLIFLAVIATIAGWWLARQKLMTKPWLEVGIIEAYSSPGKPPLPAAKIGLGVFLAVVGSLFALFTSAYFLRMDMGDWQPLPVPRVLWLNTALLAISSLSLEGARSAAFRDNIPAMRGALLAGAVSALAFLAGQLLAWQELSAEGYYLATNPANSFFYLITGLHGLHILGGLVALGGALARAFLGDTKISRMRLSVELCATYWHFMLFVWLVILAVLSGWAGAFVSMCQQLLS
jgi:cytochrome c oxidase subunit 3